MPRIYQYKTYTFTADVSIEEARTLISMIDPGVASTTAVFAADNYIVFLKVAGQKGCHPDDPHGHRAQAIASELGRLEQEATQLLVLEEVLALRRDSKAGAGDGEED